MIRLGIGKSFDLLVFPFVAETTQQFGMILNMLKEMPTIVHLWLVILTTMRSQSQLLVGLHCRLELI